MKKYYLADALTLCEIIAGVILLGMAWWKVPIADCALWVFVLGELCDAFDGICARRWPYPNDGKKRWWRTYVTQIEHLSDIFIAVACMIFLMGCPVVARKASVLGGVVILCCVAIELVVKGMRARGVAEAQIAHSIVVRRLFYVLCGVGGGILLLIEATSWPAIAKLCAVGLEVIVGIGLLILKQDRAFKP